MFNRNMQKYRIVVAAVGILLMLQSLIMPLDATVTNDTTEVNAVLRSVSVTDGEGEQFGQENKASVDSNLKISFEFTLPINTNAEELTLSLEMPDGIKFGAREDGEVAEQDEAAESAELSGDLPSGYGTYYITETETDDKRDILTITFESQQENAAITEDTLELTAHFSEDVLDYVNDEVLTLEFADKTEAAIEIPFAETEEKDADSQNEETTAQLNETVDVSALESAQEADTTIESSTAGEKEDTTSQNDETSTRIEETVSVSALGAARGGGISPYGASTVDDLIFTDITDITSSNGLATLTYVNTINGNSDDYSEIIIGANFGGDFDTSTMTISVKEIYDDSGTSKEKDADPSEYSLSGTTVTFTNTGTKQFVIRYANISTTTSYLSSYGIALDSGPVGTAGFSAQGTETSGGAIVNYSYNRNFQPLTVDTEGQDTADPAVVPNLNLHLNSILTGLTSTTASAGEEITITYDFSLNNLVYAIDAANKMSDTLTDAEKGTYSGKLNVHAGDYFVFQIDTSKIIIGNNASGDLKIGGTVIGYYLLDSSTSTMTFVFTREAELDDPIEGEISITTVTSASLQPGDTITTQINGQGESSVSIYHPSIAISKSGELDDANKQVIWTITANEDHYNVKNLQVFDNRIYAAEGTGTTAFSLYFLDAPSTLYSGSYNYWQFASSTDAIVVEAQKDGESTWTTLVQDTDYEVTSGNTGATGGQKYIKLIGGYVETSDTIRVTIKGEYYIPNGSGWANNYYFNYASVSGDNITTSVAEMSAEEKSDEGVSRYNGSAYVRAAGIVKGSSYAFEEIGGSTYLHITWKLTYNKSKADVATQNATIYDAFSTPSSTSYSSVAYYRGNSTTIAYVEFLEPDAVDDITITNSQGVTLILNTDYTVEVKKVADVYTTTTSAAKDIQYVVLITFLETPDTTSKTGYINESFSIAYDSYSKYEMPSGATSVSITNYATLGSGYYQSGAVSLSGFSKTMSKDASTNTATHTIQITPAYIPFDDGYYLYDILPQGHTLLDDTFSITARQSTWSSTIVGYPKVYASGASVASADSTAGYFELVTGEDFGTIGSNGNYDKDKDFYLIFHAGNTYTKELYYGIEYKTSYEYEANDPTGSDSKDYAVFSSSTKYRNYAYLYSGKKDGGGDLLLSVYSSFSTSSDYNYYYTENMAKAGGFTRSVAADEDGNGGSNPKITWRVYGNIWNNSLDGAILTDTLGVGAQSDGTTDASLTQSIDTSSIKLYVFDRNSTGIDGTDTITSDTGSVTVPRGTIGTINLLDSSHNLGINVDTNPTTGDLEITFPSDYEDRLRASGITGTVDGYGNVNKRFVLVYETELDETDLDHPYYTNEVKLERSTTTSDNGIFNYTDTAEGTVEIKEFTDDTYINTKIGEYDGNEKLVHYTAILNKGGQKISDDGNGNNPTIHDTLYYTVNETTGEAEQQILYLMESTLKVYEAKASSSAENGYAATKLLTAGVDYNLVYNQDELNGFDIVFTDDYIPVDTPIIVEYDAAYNHVTVPTYVNNEIYIIGYETYTSGTQTVYISETTVTSGWARQLVELNVLKVDENGDPMAGVKFALVDKNGVYRIESQITGSDGVATFTNLLEDTYLIYEVNLPDGYANSYNTLSHAATFTITSSRVSTDPDEFEITISLPSGVDTDSLMIQYEEDDGSGTSTTKTDTKATVPEDELDTTYLKFTNTSGYTANVEATKYDPYDTTKTLTDAEFYVYRYYEKNNGEVVKQYYQEDGTTTNNGIAVFTEDISTAKLFDTLTGSKFMIENLPVGVYYLEEETVPYGYEAPSSDFELEITKAMIDEYRAENPTAATVTFEKKVPNFEKTGSITINKKNNQDDLLSGVYFLVEVLEGTDYIPIFYNTDTWLWEEITDGSTYSAITDQYGQIIFSSLLEGEYRITEIKPSGDDYALMTEPIYVSIPYELKVAKGVSPNDTGYDSEDLTSDPYYDYYYYYNITFTITNSNVFGLPEAGESNGGFLLIILVGIGIVLLAGSLYYYRRRKLLKIRSRQ